MSDKEKIAEKINEYYASMYESNSEMVHAVFHPNASVTGYLHGELVEMTTDSFAAFVKSQQPSPKEKNDVVLLEILTSEMAGSTACARVRDAYLGMVFLDTLSLLKVGDDWLIYSKLFHVES